MQVKTLLSQIGDPFKNGFKGIRAAYDSRKSRISPLKRERIQFEEEMRQQFEKLQEKGLSIPVFTL